jgi:hypothetical protein
MKQQLFKHHPATALAEGVFSLLSNDKQQKGFKDQE